MRASTNISLKDRQTLSVSDFKGVDFTSSPHRIAPNRAADAVNLLYEDGVMRKRKGWRQKYIVTNEDDGIEDEYRRIDGFYHFQSGSKDVILVWSQGLFEIDRQTKKIKCLLDEWYLAGQTNGMRVRFIQQKERCYILGVDNTEGTHQVMIYGCWDAEKGYEVKRMSDTDEAYIPTTTISIDPIDVEDTQVAVLESPNLLTARRKNELCFTGGWQMVEELPEEGTTEYLAWKTRCWRLDDDIASVQDMILTVVYDSGEERRFCAVDQDTLDDRGITMYCLDSGMDFYDLSEEEKAIIKEKAKNGERVYLIPCENDGVTPPIYGYVIPCAESIETETNPKGWNICFNEAREKLSRVTDLIVEFTPASYTPDADVIYKATHGFLFGVNGNTDRLFLINGNRIQWSASMDDTYFPENQYVTVGQTDVPINGIVRLSDRTMGILKPESGRDATIFYLAGSLQNQYDSSGNLVGGQTVFTVSSGGANEGNRNACTPATLAGDPLILSQNGVFGITLTDNVATDARYAKERSYLISKRLLAHDLSDAVAIVYKNRYYLSVDNVCYVADPRYKYYPEGNDLDGSFHYEWWYWENVPARCWAIIDDQLWFGTADGRLCAFDGTDYFDDSYRMLHQGELTLGADGTTFTHSQFVSVRDGDELMMDGANLLGIVLEKIPLTQDSDGYYGTDADGIDRLAEGMELTAEGLGGYGFLQVTVKEVDRLKNRFRLDQMPPGVDFFSLLKQFGGKRLKITNAEEATCSFQVKEYRNGEILTFRRNDDHDQLSPENVECHYLQAVAAHWITPYFDMGSSLYGKTMLRFTVTAEEESGHFQFGYETKRAGDSRRIQGIDSLRFDDFSFERFSFDNDFASSHTIRTNVRNFNYIRFRFLSEEAEPFSVQGFTALYKINKMNRGVR